MPLWDDATQSYTGQQQPQDSGSLWGWLTSLFSPRPMPGSGLDSAGLPLYPFRGGDPTASAPPTTPSMASWWGGRGFGGGGGTAATPSAVDTSWNANPWANMSGIPASMQVAPPSMFTAANPQQQALWQQASNPIGYAAMIQPPTSAAATAPAAVPVRTPPAAMMPPPPKPMPPPVIERPRNIMPPAGGSTGWGGYGGMGILPPGYAPTAPPPSLVAPSPAASSIPLTDTKSRNLTDAELEKMSKEDIALIDRSDLTYGDRMAILRRLGR